MAITIAEAWTESYKAIAEIMLDGTEYPSETFLTETLPSKTAPLNLQPVLKEILIPIEIGQ